MFQGKYISAVIYPEILFTSKLTYFLAIFCAPASGNAVKFYTEITLFWSLKNAISAIKRQSVSYHVTNNLVLDRKLPVGKSDSRRVVTAN